MNAIAWTSDGSVGVYGVITNEDLFDSSTTIRDSFGRVHKFMSCNVKPVGMNPDLRVKHLEQVIRNLIGKMNSYSEIAKNAL